MLEDSQIPAAPRKSIRNVAIALASVLVVIGLVAGGVIVAFDSIGNFISRFQVEDYTGAGTGSTQIVIEPGDDAITFGGRGGAAFRQADARIEAQLAVGEVGAALVDEVRDQRAEDRARDALDQVVVADEDAVVGAVVPHLEGLAAQFRRP